MVVVAVQECLSERPVVCDNDDAAYSCAFLQDIVCNDDGQQAICGEAPHVFDGAFCNVRDDDPERRCYDK